jgi:AcrR family transcriptional regulator
MNADDRNKRGPDAGRRTKRFEAILAAALDEFVANGFAMARLDAVAGRARVATGTIYLYAERKEELFRAVVRDAIAPMVADLTDRSTASRGRASNCSAT